MGIPILITTQIHDDQFFSHFSKLTWCEINECMVLGLIIIRIIFLCNHLSYIYNAYVYVFGSPKACAIDKYNISIKFCIISLKLKTLRQLAVCRMGWVKFVID
jgi:hypothetical protein